MRLHHFQISKPICTVLIGRVSACFAVNLLSNMSCLKIESSHLLSLKLYFSDIKKLLTEVQDYQVKHKNSPNISPDSEEPSTSGSSSGAGTPGGMIADRFNQGASIVITGNSKGSGRSGFELRLPSMSLFTSKMSNQNLFLRMLKVVIQLREAARKAAKRATETHRQCKSLLI